MAVRYRWRRRSHLPRPPYQVQRHQEGLGLDVRESNLRGRPLRFSVEQDLIAGLAVIWQMDFSFGLDAGVAVYRALGVVQFGGSAVALGVRDSGVAGGR